MKKNNHQKSIHSGVKEIAKMANVSIATVDRVLHNRAGVAPSTKRRIHRIIKELDYKPNIIASRLASRKVFHFAVLIPAVSDETDFWQGPLNGVIRAEKTIKEYGVKIDFYFFDISNRNSFVEQSHKVFNNNVDGVLLAPSFINEAKIFTEECRKNKVPYVLIDSNIPHEENLCYIGPHLFRSGLLGAQLVNLMLGEEGEILIVNIAHEVDDHNYLLEIEQGFRSYFSYRDLHPDIHKIDLRQTDYASIAKSLDKIFRTKDTPIAVFVTNSRVNIVARYFEEAKIEIELLIGFDFINKNIEYLKKGIIDVLICHKSEEQGYKGIMALYQHLVLEETVENIHFMPIDIITSENCEFYSN
ncbi:MAG: LacI family DNA-binding transcriptional regulator [Chitinophagaceae bacterium]|nr:MAG: LacI family DNA-binding transcriptional regulator [Chitinophagaceae bacterium]